MAAIPGLEEVNPTDIFSGMWATLPPEILSRISLISQLGKIVFILIIVYIILLILLKIIGFFQGSRRLNKISKNLESVNEKLGEIADLLKNVREKGKVSEKKSKNSKL